MVKYLHSPMSSKRFLLSLLVLAPLFLLSSAFAADRDQTTLKLVVTDEAKERPVPKAAVTLNFVAGRKMKVLRKIQREWNTKTNSKGVAEFPEIPTGTVKVQVIAAGYQTYGDTIDLKEGDQEVTVKLKKPSGRQISAHEPEQ